MDTLLDGACETLPRLTLAGSSDEAGGAVVMMGAAMDEQFEPRSGDVVVIRVSPDGRPDPERPSRFGVIEWGSFTFVSERLSDLSKADAVVEARHCASERGREAWDSTAPAMVRLPRLPLVYRDAFRSYSVSLDVTPDATSVTRLQWKSASGLSESEALAAIRENGVPDELAKALVGKAPMPEACS